MFRKLYDDIMSRISAEDLAADERDATIQMATAVLMVDVALVDTTFDEAEFDRMIQLIKDQFHLSTEAAADLINAANAEADDLISVYEFTKVLHEYLDHDDKARVVELLWAVACADGELDKYENSLVLKVSDLLHVKRPLVMRLRHDAVTAMTAA